MAALLGLLPALVATIALGRAADDWRLAAAIGGLATLLALIGPRWEVDRGRRMLTAAMGAGAGYLVVGFLYDPHRGSLGEGWTRLAAAAILAAAARFLLVGMQGRTVTTALVFVALLAAGETHVSGYAAFVGLFLLTSVWAPALRDEHRLLGGTRPQRIAMGAALLLTGAAMATGTTLGAYRAYGWIASRERSFALSWTPQVGFSDQIDLGALDGLLDSDTVVLRVHGPRVDYLRGSVLDGYAGGRWYRSDATEAQVATTYDRESPPGPGDEVKIAAVAERTDRFFLPLDARSIVTSPGSVFVDATGSVKRNGKRGTEVARFIAGPRDRAAPSDPGPSNLQIPRSLRPRLEELAAQWTGGKVGTAEKLDAIEQRFKSGFRYARSFSRMGGPDPMLDFLFGARSGHCEYFASAMTLVARAAGIPARFVAGYRVGEQSPFGYHVVRERNAHAWVEAWVPGRGWTTHDPTPDTELPQNREHRSGYLASLSDGLRVAYDDADDWLERRTLEQTAVAWVFGFAVLVWIVARGVLRRGAGGSPLRDEEAALPCLAVLLSALARAGFTHDAFEPIERLAARTTDGEAARLLERYAALRYGGRGDPDALANDVAAYAQRQRKPASPVDAPS